MVEVMKMDLQKVLCRHCYTQCPRPCSSPPLNLSSTRDSWTHIGKSGSVSCGVTAPFSWVLVHSRFCVCVCVCVPSKNLFPQSCVSSGSSVVELMVTSSKRAYAIPRSAAPRAPTPATVHCWPLPPHETLKHSSVSVSVVSLGSGAHKVCLSPLSFSGGNGVWLLALRGQERKTFVRFLFKSSSITYTVNILSIDLINCYLKCLNCYFKLSLINTC